MTTTGARSRRRSGTTPVVLAVAAVLLVALAAALLGGDGGDGDDGAGGFDLTSMAVPTIEGRPLAPGSDGDQAPYALGPALLSEGRQQVPVPGEATMIVFLAHWCRYCNAEVPVVNQWLTEQGLPEGIELRAVATGIDETLPNHPPTTWLRERDWTVPTMVDVDGSVAEAYGVDSYPYWVFVDANGVTRGTAGPLTVDELAAVAAELTAG